MNIGIVGLVNMNRQSSLFGSVLAMGVISCMITIALVAYCNAYAGAISLALQKPC